MSPVPSPHEYFWTVDGLYRAYEATDGTWSCRRGQALVDRHASLNDALAHLFKLAGEEEAPAYVYAHWLGGRVELMGEGHHA
jgi:hypothetical protein